MNSKRTTIKLTAAHTKLRELIDKESRGQNFILTEHSEELAVLIGINKYRRLVAISQQQREMDFNMLMAPPPSESLSEDDARELAVQIIREQRACHDSSIEA